MNFVPPDVLSPVVDRLAFLLQWGVGAEANQDELLAPIKKRLKKMIKEGTCQRAYLKGSRYRENFRIKFDERTIALVQIGALQPEVQKGGIRVLVNPSKFKLGDVLHLNRVMERIVGPIYSELMQRPLINIIDFAVDIIGAHLDYVLVDYSNAQRRTTFCKRTDGKGRIEGYNFGSVTSDYMAAVYDKRSERVHAAVVEIAKRGLGAEGLKSNLVKQLKRAKHGPDIVRVEVRGKKLRGMSLSDVAELPNRFERFRFADLNASGTNLSDLTELAFRALCRDSGVKAALAAFRHTKNARKVHAYWRSHQAAWWQPALFWQQGCDALRAIGLFPDEAFAPDRDT